MSLSDLVNHATNKKRFQSIYDYINFSREYLRFIETGLQARIISKNENHYQFYQYKNDGYYSIRLNALDGAYYCDIRPNMSTDILLSRHIQTIDRFFYNDIWQLLRERGQSLNEVEIDEEDEGN